MPAFAEAIPGSCVAPNMGPMIPQMGVLRCPAAASKYPGALPEDTYRVAKKPSLAIVSRVNLAYEVAHALHLVIRHAALPGLRGPDLRRLRNIHVHV